MDQIYKTSQAAILTNELIEQGFPIYAGRSTEDMAILRKPLTLRPSATTGTKMYFYDLSQYWLLFSGNYVPYIAIQDHLYPLFKVNADQEWTPLYKVYHPQLKAGNRSVTPITQIIVQVNELKHLRKRLYLSREGLYLSRDGVSLPILDVDRDAQDGEKVTFISYGDPLQDIYYGPVYQESEGIRDEKSNPIHIFATYLIIG